MARMVILVGLFNGGNGTENTNNLTVAIADWCSGSDIMMKGLAIMFRALNLCWRLGDKTKPDPRSSGMFSSRMAPRYRFVCSVISDRVDIIADKSMIVPCASAQGKQNPGIFQILILR